MYSGYFEKLISTESLLVDAVSDYIVTEADDYILIGASPFSSLRGSVEIGEIITGTLDADTIDQTISICRINGTVAGGIDGMLR